MRLERFAASADLVGRRVRISWEISLARGERLDGVPRLLLRRKQRDFEFPPAPSTGADPFLVYDSAALAPPGTTVTEVDLGESRADGLRTTTLARSVSRRIGDVSVEVLRHTRSVSYDAQRRPVRARDDIVDVGGGADGLAPGVTCYYHLASVSTTPGQPVVSLRAVATPTEAHRSGRLMYELLPAIIRRHDVVKGPPRAAGAIPEAATDAGQLRRFFDLFGTGIDHVRSRADGLRGLHEVDTVDHRMLEHLAAYVGWDLGHDKSIPIQRHEIKYAAALYRVTGTLPGCAIWVRRLSGWDAEFKELWRNVFFSNDVGNRLSAADDGSTTVDTGTRAKPNTPLFDAMGTIEDTVDYVCDTRTGPGLHYAPNVIAIFVRAQAGDLDAARKRARIAEGARLFLPFNLRAVVLDADQFTK